MTRKSDMKYSLFLVSQIHIHTLKRIVLADKSILNSSEVSLVDKPIDYL